MESSDEALIIRPFSMPPLTLKGRSIALRIIFCKSLSHAWLRLLRTAWRAARQCRASVAYLLSALLSWLHPRNPSFILLAIGGATVILQLRRKTTASSSGGIAYRQGFWKKVMKAALTYDEWAHAARMLELEERRAGLVRWKDAEFYDEELVRSKVAELRRRRQDGGIRDILYWLRADLVRNFGNMCNPALHRGGLQTPDLIEGYIDEVQYHLREVCNAQAGAFTQEEKISFMHEARHAYGRTALVLSGGAALGAFHVGVVRTLIRYRLLPRILAGAGVGSIVCALAATRTWPELQSFFEDSNPSLTLHRLLSAANGAVATGFQQLIGDLTFNEAYDLSGCVLAIYAVPYGHGRCFNYLTTPNATIWSAVAASCAPPSLVEVPELMAKNRKGELVPCRFLAESAKEPRIAGGWQWQSNLKELFNVNHFIVSQADPQIAPLLTAKERIRTYGGDLAAKLVQVVEMEVKHRCRQLLQLGLPLGRLTKILVQDWEGDITIVMSPTLAQFAKLAQNPTPAELRKAVMQGSRCTWAKLSAIKANCGIELMLDECVVELKHQQKLLQDAERSLTKSSNGGSSAFRSTSKRIPSWICLSRENSSGSLEDQGMEGGGPWGGRSLRKLTSVEASVDGNDNNDPMETSWTKAGGPLMKSPSANRLIIMLGSNKDASKNVPGNKKVRES